MTYHILSPGRGVRVFTVGLAATVSLYAIVAMLAEPLRAFGAASSSTTVVSLTINTTITNSCTATVDITNGLGMNGTNADTSSNNGYDSADATTCTVYTNNTTGYTFAWQILTGTGAAGSRTGTGHLNGFIAGNRIAPFKPTVASTPQVWNTSTIAATDARWAGRLSSTSTTNTGAGMHWGTDVNGANDRWLNIATGSLVNIAKSSTFTSTGGDLQRVGFRAIIGNNKVVPADTYRATVTFTATTNP